MEGPEGSGDPPGSSGRAGLPDEVPPSGDFPAGAGRRQRPGWWAGDRAVGVTAALTGATPPLAQPSELLRRRLGTPTADDLVAILSRG